MSVDDLSHKSRKELQALAKVNGIKANKSTKAIIHDLLSVMTDVASTPAHASISMSLPAATSSFLPTVSEAPPTPPAINEFNTVKSSPAQGWLSYSIGTKAATEPTQLDATSPMAFYVPSCSQCSTIDYDDMIHCDFCEVEVCRMCDRLKQTCGVEDAKEICGKVRCGACLLTQQGKWEHCKTCGVVVCTECNDRGHKILLEKGLDINTVCCHVCANMENY